MDFSKSIKRIYDTNWSYVNNFTVHFLFGESSLIQTLWSDIDHRDMNLYVKSFNTPTFNNSPIEAYIGDQYKIHNGRNEMYRFTVSFRDFDQMNLYRRFVQTYNLQRTMYFDQCKTTVLLLKNADYISETDNILFEFKNCLIESVSQVQFSNETEAQIVEFDIEFKCATPILN